MTGPVVFGSPEANAILRRDRAAARMVVDNGCKEGEDCQDHIFDGSAKAALCGARLSPCGDEYRRPYDPAGGQIDDVGICEDCLRALLTEPQP